MPHNSINIKKRAVLIVLTAYARLEYGVAYIRSGLKRKVLVCYPQRPHVSYVLYTIAALCGYAITRNIEGAADAVMHFEDWTMRRSDPKIDGVRRIRHVINADCDNISKAKVDRVFKEVFGYDITIDPERHEGVCVRKSNINAMHDGVVLSCPLKPEEGYVYQKLIDNSRDPHTVVDIRVSVIGNTLPVAIRRYRNIAYRFGKTDAVHLSSISEEFSSAEVDSILDFCRAFRVEYGDLDIIRDAHDGKIYIVDVNTTPYGPLPWTHMPWKDYTTYIHTLARTFTAQFEQHESQRRLAKK